MRCETEWEKAERKATVDHMERLIIRGADQEDVFREFKAGRRERDCVIARLRRRRRSPE